MNKGIKLIYAIGILSIMVLLLSGCKQENSTEEDTAYQEKYHSDIYTLINGQEYVTCFVHKEEDIFLSTAFYDPDSDIYGEQIYHVDAQSHELNQLNCKEITEENIRYLSVNEDESIEIVTEKENCYYINTFEVEGELIRRIDISDIIFSALQSEMYVVDVAMDDKRNFYFACNAHNNKDSTLIKLAYTGEVLFISSFRGVINQIAVNEANEIIAAYQNEENNLKFCVFGSDANQINTLVSEFSYRGACLSITYGRDEDTIYFCTEDTFYEYDYGNHNMTAIVSLSEIGLGSGVIVDIVQVSDGSLELLYNEEDAENKINSLLIVLTKGDYMGNEDGKKVKKELVIATFEDSTILSRVVKQFNKESKDCYFKIKKYSPDTDGITLLQADMAAGNVPDILDVGNLNTAAYIDKGIFADLGAYLDKDVDISRDDFLGQAVETYSKDGKIYALPSMVWIGSMVAKTENLNGLTNWNLQEFQEFVNGSDNPKMAVMASTKETMFQRMIAQYSDHFIDWGIGKCNLTGNEFLALLEFCNMFPLESESYDAAEEIRFIREDQILLFPTVMNSTMSFQINRAIANADVTYIGYPTENGNGTQLIIFGSVYAITEQCEEKEAAWEVVKALCTNEDIYYEGFPTYKKQLEKAYENSAVKAYATDENGNRVETYTAQVNYGDEVLDIYAMTEEETDTLRKLIENAELANTQHPAVNALLLEEVLPYFYGQKSAIETAEVMQSRVQIYLDENN